MSFYSVSYYSNPNMNVYGNPYNKRLSFGNSFAQNGFSVFNNNNFQQPAQDSIVNGNVKSTTSKTKKVLKDLGIAATIGGIAYLAIKGKIGAAKQEATKLAKHIKFKPAQTVEGAAQFAKTHFGIKTYSVDNLEIANWVNKGMSKVVNKTKGKAVLPDNVFYKAIENNTSAIMYVKDKDLIINKNYFNNIDEYIKEDLPKWLQDDKIETYIKNGYINITNKYYNLYKQGKLNLVQKSNFKQLLTHNIWLNTYILKGHPEEVVNFYYKNFVPKNGLLHIDDKVFSLDEMLALPKKELTNHAIRLAEEVNRITGKKFCFDGMFRGKFVGSERYIFHELGHLAHQKSYALCDQCHTLNVYKQFNLQPTKMLKDFLANPEEQRIAKLVSGYAASSPNEFVAETFSYLVKGEKFPKEVMDLYKKYGDPLI